MKIKQEVIFSLILLGLMLLISGIQGVAAVDLDVGPGQTYSTISDAVSAANSGDNINIYDNEGTPYIYNEKVYLTKNNLNLTGMGNVTIQGVPADPSDEFDAIVILSGGSAIKNLAINGSNFFGIRMAENATVENCQVSGTTIGVRVNRVNNVTIINNIFTNCDTGIYLDSGSNALISGNKIINNQVGINSQGMNYQTITKNIISGNTIEAIFVNGNYYNTITENVITNNGAGINCVIVDNLNVHFNQIFGNTQYGLRNEYGPGYPQNGVVLADNNWWGYNDQANVQNQIINVSGTVIYSPWLVLNLYTSKQGTPTGLKATVTADLTINSDGTDTSTLGHVPDGIPVKFKINRMVFDRWNRNIDAYTTAGKATVDLKAFEATRISVISATVDGQTVTYRTLKPNFSIE